MCAETPRSAPIDDLRRFLHGAVNLGRTGIPWWDLLPRFGHWNSIFCCFRRWCQAGLWTCMRTAVVKD